MNLLLIQWYLNQDTCTPLTMPSYVSIHFMLCTLAVVVISHRLVDIGKRPFVFLKKKTRAVNSVARFSVCAHNDVYMHIPIELPADFQL